MTHLPGHRLLRLPRSRLVAAVSPAKLGPALANLREAGIISGFEERGREVYIWGDLLTMEARLGFDAVEPNALAVAGNVAAAYFRLCRDFQATATFARLSARQKAIWRLHASGEPWTAIGVRLGVSLRGVREAIKGARLAAGLPEATSAIPRGGGAGRPPGPVTKCKVDGCSSQAMAKGYCNPCYQKAKRMAMRAIFPKTG